MVLFICAAVMSTIEGRERLLTVSSSRNNSPGTRKRLSPNRLQRLPTLLRGWVPLAQTLCALREVAGEQGPKYVVKFSELLGARCKVVAPLGVVIITRRLFDEGVVYNCWIGRVFDTFECASLKISKLEMDNTHWDNCRVYTRLV